MWSRKKCTRCICAATGLVVLVIVICVFTVVGSLAPISVTGSEAHIQEINEVKNSLFEVNNRINISGIGLLLIVLVIMGRANYTFGGHLKREGLSCLKSNFHFNLVNLDM